MKVTRRTFLKTLSGAVVAVISGVGVDNVLSAADQEQYLFEGGNLLINTKTKVITYIGNDEIRLADFYNYLKELWEEESSLLDSDIPMVCETPVQYTFIQSTDQKILGSL